MFVAVLSVARNLALFDLAIDHRIQYDAAAGVALARGDVAGALLPVEGLLAHLAGSDTGKGASQWRGVGGPMMMGGSEAAVLKRLE